MAGRKRKSRWANHAAEKRERTYITLITYIE